VIVRITTHQKERRCIILAQFSAFAPGIVLNHQSYTLLITSQSSLCLVLALSGLLVSQSAVSARSQEEPNEQTEGRESVQRREQWFLQGRDTRPGQSAATLRRKAVEQKLWMRSVRSQNLAAAAKVHPDYVSGRGQSMTRQERSDRIG
jgi:hypothetical protein